MTATTLVDDGASRGAQPEETPMPKFRIDAAAAMDAMETALARMEKIDGTIAADPGGGSKNSSYNARISKELQFIAHLCKRAEDAVMDEFYSFKGEQAHERLGGSR